jgi:transcriptional regulator with XRE-family HTH domain
MAQSDAGSSSGAETTIERLRAALAEDNPAFLKTELAERDAELLCMKVRKDMRHKRKLLHVDQATMAERMNLGQSSISKIENGRGDIGLKSIHRYAHAIRMRPLLLFVPMPAALAEQDENATATGAIEAIVSAQDMFLRKMSEMLPDLTERTTKSA